MGSDDDLSNGEEERYEDEEEEGEDEEEETQSKRRKASMFIDAEAVEDDEEDDDESHMGDQMNDFIVANDDDDNQSVHSHRSAISTRSQSRLPSRKTTTSVADIERRYVQRAVMPVQDLSDAHQNSLYPTVADPKLFIVKCRQGKEKEAALSLLSKFLEVERTGGEPLLIKSAVTVESLKGFIYVEAFKEAHIKQAVRGLRVLSEYNLRLVPISEMPDVLRTSTRKMSIKQNSWVRVNKGVYKGDLAQVWLVDEARARVTVKIIPRIDYSAIQTPAQKDKGKRPRQPRPPPRLFNPEEAKEYGGSVDVNKGDRDGSGERFTLFNGHKFKHGYLFKDVNIKSLDTDNIQPTLEELARFNQKGTVDPSLAAAIAGRKKAQLAKGDTVQVTEGDLKYLMGVIEKIDGDTILIRPISEEIKEPIQFLASQLQKYFRVGDQCKVVEGRHKGETGMIVKIDNSTVVLFSDSTMTEIEVLISDIQASTEKSTGLNTNGIYAIHDLIKIDNQTVGIIVKVDKDTFKVLDNNGILSDMSLQQMGPKRNTRGSYTYDKYNNMLAQNDAIRVVDGPYAGRTAVVKHVFKKAIFAHAKDLLENNGIFVVNAKMCELRGARVKALTPTNDRRGAGPGPQRGGFGGFPGGGFGRGRGRSRNASMITKTVKITKGPYKGYLGIVVDATDAVARVEMHTTMKTINVDVNDIAVIDGMRGEFTTTTFQNTTMRGRDNNRRNMDGSQTPAWTRDDNSGFGRTPLHPSMDGSQTPTHHGAWDRNRPNTPMRTDSSWDPFSAPDYDLPSTPSTGLGMGNRNSTPFSPFSPAIPSEHGGYNPSTPGYVHTPASEVATPKDYSATPDIPHTPGPRTPGPQTPATPGFHTSTPGLTVEEETGGSSDSLISGIEAKYTGYTLDTNDTSDNANIVTILEVFGTAVAGGGRCKVRLRDGREEVVEAEFLRPVPPSKKDKVKIIKGEMRGMVGELHGIDERDGIVKIEGTKAIHILQMSFLGKIPRDLY